MKVTIISHGKTEYDFEKRLQGRENIPLNDEGRRECRKVKFDIKTEKFDICFSSPLIRTVETAMILVGDRVEIKIDERLIERELGKLEGTYFNGYDEKKYWDYNLNLDVYGIEPIQELIKRVNSFVDYLKENYKDKKILIVTHNSIVKILHHIFHKDINNNLLNYTIGNCYMEIIDD